MNSANASPSQEWQVWDQKRVSLKNRWVIAVVVFWLTVGFQVALFFLNGDLNLVLLSIATGMLALGIGLKTRLQMHLRREPSRRDAPA